MLADTQESSDISIPETYLSEDATETESADSADGQQVSEHKKILIAYFTWVENAADTSEVDATTSASVQLPGNVAQMAAWIHQEVGGELFSIRVEEPYPADYDACLDRAADEKAENARPKLVEKVSDLSEYDVVFLGYPNWWYSAPMAVFSFLEENDLSGKKVVLFCSHGTGGLASSVKDISAVLPDSQIESNVLGVYRDDISQSQETIQNWLEEIGY
ncbi:flavodoxin [Roseburia hominis]